MYWITKKSQNCCFGKKRDGSRSVGAKVCGDTFYIVIGVGLLIFVPGLIFMIMEEWSFLEGSYYSFITLTTIGFGDYVAGKKVDGIHLMNASGMFDILWSRLKHLIFVK